MATMYAYCLLRMLRMETRYGYQIRIRINSSTGSCWLLKLTGIYEESCSALSPRPLRDTLSTQGKPKAQLSKRGSTVNKVLHTLPLKLAFAALQRAQHRWCLCRGTDVAARDAVSFLEIFFISKCMNFPGICTFVVFCFSNARFWSLWANV